MTMLNAAERSFEKAPFHRLTEQQCQRLFWACLEILERTGVLLYDSEALELLKKVGVNASDGNRVRIPSHLIERALSTAPNEITFFDRLGGEAIKLEGIRSYFGSGSDCLFIIDHRSGERRRARLQDVIEGVTVADALPNIDFIMCMFLPEDVPQQVVDAYQMEAMLNHSTKPIVFVTNDFPGCIRAIRMAEVVAGGERPLQEKPFVSCYINVTTGLVHNQEALQKLLYLSERGIPAAYIPSTQGGVTAPVTPAAALAVSQAGALVGLVLSQLKREGSPVLMPGWGGNMLDMRTTTQPYADPDKRLLAIDFVHYLGMPMFSLAGCSDSKIIDQQAAIEAALTLMSDAVGGGHLVHDLGYLESGLSGSLVQLAVCNEILSWLDHFTAQIEINDDTLALDLIDQVGPDGQFLDSDHTFRHYRERWYPDLFDRDNFDGWQARGSTSLVDRASKRVSKILAEYEPKPLPAEVQSELAAIVQQAAESSTKD
jgi:trimethylamine---corrinoid protein Co-methyltransferase